MCWPIYFSSYWEMLFKSLIQLHVGNRTNITLYVQHYIFVVQWEKHREYTDSNFQIQKLNIVTGKIK